MTQLAHEPPRRAVILRGIPGAGKSTLAAELARESGLAREACVFSTDRLFDELHGGEFSALLLNRLHQINLTRFIHAAARHMPLIVCDNTNTEPWEYSAYEAAARAMGYAIEVRVVGAPWNQAEVELCATRNLRRVPAEIVRAMAARLVESLQQTNSHAR